MGSTVTTGRMAAAFRAKSGAVIYCLYEQTYEKNCYPHTPHWSAIYIGDAPGALRKVFNYASSCEGGMLQNRSGWMTPEGYLRSWLTELQSPVRMTRDHSISIFAESDSIYAPLTKDMMPAVAANLVAAGLKTSADQLLAGEKVTLSLFDHGDLIATLMDEHQVSAWSLLPEYTRPRAEAERFSSLGVASAKSKAPTPVFQPALIVSEHGDIILRSADGVWRCCGSRYEIISAYIQSLATVEQTHPGSYRNLIQSYREHLKAARKVNPSCVKVQTDRRPAEKGWEAKKIEEAAALPGAISDGDIVTIPFSKEHEYTLVHLPRAATTWRVLDETCLSPGTIHAEQVSLL
jgi:hypothetical protein